MHMDEIRYSQKPTKQNYGNSGLTVYLVCHL